MQRRIFGLGDDADCCLRVAKYLIWGKEEMRKAKLATMSAAVALASSIGAAPAQAQTEPYVGQLMLVGFNFCPRYWSQANGQLISIQQYPALYALYGTIYGGNGTTTFALPDLRGRVPVSYGQQNGGQPYPIGQYGGLESVTLLQQQMPAHMHTGRIVADKDVAANKANPAGNSLARSTVVDIYTDNLSGLDDLMANGTVQTDFTGGNQPHENRMPYLAMNWCVAMTGVFPPRN